ncbi:pathogenesis-related protein PR-1-like [Sesamum indicum]|uniref:Pathogenesis-related protein PR-1-like n=1 Tax=Sesamum indicum TaxID=4182 RepID=A0A6I9SS25_SESIN|nr:pathogenesis-related protein PR-1-like [Sesamum indicum]
MTNLILQMINPCRGLILTIFLVFVFVRTTTGAAAKPPSDAQQFLSVQNAARAALKLPPLVWDPKIARYAAWYANQRRADCELEHSNGPYGENIFWGSGNRWTAAQAAAAWVSERREYNYWSNSCVYGQECGHYTQIVWKDTRRMGCARVVCYGGRGVFMICNYDPPGNYIGERPY